MALRLKKLLVAGPLLWSMASGVPADFSHSAVAAHPAYPGAQPFLLELSGTWPSDCHPGEQRPVVASFDGLTVSVEFEIIVVHVTCNDFDTPYRVLVDMSAVLRGQPVTGDRIEVRVDYLGARLEQSLELSCAPPNECPTAPVVLPEPGQYATTGRDSEGLLVDRQHDVLVIYPLVYDETGRAEWLFSAGRVAGDSLFAELYRFAGGDCFDCLPTGAEAGIEPAGHLSALFDRPDTLFLKVNDRLFTEYRKLLFGYRFFRFAETPGWPLVDLEGRWALSENRGTDPPLGDLSEFLPPAFEAALEYATPAAGNKGTFTEVGYLLTDITGGSLGQLICAPAEDGPGFRPVCAFIDVTDQAEPLLLLYQEGPDSLSIVYARPVIAIGTPPGGAAVRLD